MPSTPIVERLGVLSDETRVRILSVLARGEFTVSELRAVLQLPQPRVSHHLKLLADDGWVDVRADGRRRHYRVSADMDPLSRELWRIVRTDLERRRAFGADAERAEAVQGERRSRAAQFFAGAAGRWDDVRHTLFGPRAGILPLFGLLDARWTVGDLGTGTGGLPALLAPHVARVIGVDRSREMLEAARRRTQGYDHVEYREGDLEDLPIGDGELDVAILSLVLHYVVDPPDVLAEARRTLCPGGHLIIVDMRPHERGATYAKEMGHIWPGFDMRQMEEWLRDTRFGRIQIRPLPPDPQAEGPLLFLATAVRP